MRDDTPTSMSALIPLESLLDKPARPRVNIQALREKLASGRGPAFWRTLEEAAETDEMREYIEQEFPGLSGQIPQGVDRRSLLKVMAASLAMAGAAACTKQPKELIVPYVRQPENVTPGVALFYATAMTTGGYKVSQTEDTRGPIKAGYFADLIAMPGNPLDDVDALKNVQFVMKDGQVFKRDGVMTPAAFFHGGPVNGWRIR